MTKESEFFLKIEIWNQNRQRPAFRWLKSGDISLGLAVTSEYISKKIPENREKFYSVSITLNKSMRENGNAPIYEKEPTQGNIRKSVIEFQDFITSKFGFSMKKEIEKALS